MLTETDLNMSSEKVTVGLGEILWDLLPLGKVMGGAPDNFAYQPVLRHGDFGTVNLLYDPQAKALSGVIDFGNAGLGDPALDIAYLIAPFGYGDKIIDRLALDYPLDDDLLARARFYVSTFALQEALYGIEHDNTRAFNLGLAGYHPPTARW